MNCTACSDPIDKNRGYYLVVGTPYCVNCYQASDEAPDIRHSPQQEPEDLLDAFRAHQKRIQACACQSF